MARGRHAASAAKRRAESAEEQLDRLLPQLYEAKRRAGQYETDAKSVPALQARIKALTGDVVPRAEHEATVSSMTERHDLQMLETCAAFDAVLAIVADFIRVKGGDAGDPFGLASTPSMMDALRALPGDRAIDFVTALGLPRDEARMLVRPGLSRAIADENRREVAINLGRKATEQGLPGIPSDWLDDQTTIHRRLRPGP